MIPHSRPCLGDDDAAAVLKVLGSGRLVQGEMVAALEAAFVRLMAGEETNAKFPVPGGRGRNPASISGNESHEIHCPRNDPPSPARPFHGAAVSSGTMALHLTLLALGIGRDDEVVIPSYVCASLWHAVRAAGATPVLADCDGETFNICAADVEKLITDRTRAIIAPHLFGQAADLDALLAFDIPVIEDCAQSLGGTYRDRPTGGFGVAAVFSFYATKVIASGEGGLVVSRDGGLIERIRDLREYDEKDDLSLRFNGKLTDIQAALALSQLGKLPAFIARRKAIAKRYDRTLKEFGPASRLQDERAMKPLGLQPPRRRDDRDHIFFRYVVMVEEEAAKVATAGDTMSMSAEAEAFIAAMGKRGVACRRPVFRPLHRYLGRTGFETTEKIWRHAVSIPLYPDLSDEEITVVEAALEETCREAAGRSADED
ncbi:MAG TPA: DegT/DnrJ/EryC1/StrS family aminotransferase [Syntrophales bacterium]|nr:DegT/DnrJ/EryC1/StrS family aminotransferase [Syntrophales bacterium]